MASLLSLPDYPASSTTSMDSQSTYIMETHNNGVTPSESTRSSTTTTIFPSLNAASIFSFTTLIGRYMASFVVSTFRKNQDVLKLLFIGGSIGFARHACSSLWQRFVGFFFLTAHIHHPDEAYSWMMVWLSQQNNSILNTREVQICTGNWGLAYHKNVAILAPGPTASTSTTIHAHSDTANLHKTRLLSYLPAFGVKQWIKYRGTWMSIYRKKELGTSQGGNRGFQYETLVVSLFTRDWSVLQLLLQEARDCYKSNEENLVCVYGINKDNFSWTRISEKAKRPLNTIVLPSEIKTALLADLKAFLSSERWYVDKGIPYRRGYLFYGVPGSGKSSLIHGIAGELNLNIYMVSLSIKDLDDSTLCKIISQVPARSAIVFEDLDVLSPHRSTNSLNDKESAISLRQAIKPGSLTLSGLLNALDGLSAQEGRIIFATSNKYDDLDPALRRPGRLDRHFEFSNATKEQTKEFFLNFYRYLVGITPSAMRDLLQLQKDEADTAGTDAGAGGISADELEALGVEFSDGIPDRMFSMALIQEYLVQYKYQPRAAVAGVGKWVKEEASRSNA